MQGKQSDSLKINADVIVRFAAVDGDFQRRFAVVVLGVDWNALEGITNVKWIVQKN